MKETFRNPPTRFRSIPFWAWNGRMEEEEIREQIREMHRQGIGGFFIHSREGLETPYMGEQWNLCVAAAVQEAKKLGMQAWLYDEDRWPSGTAGGSVPARYGDEARCKGLTLQVCEPDDMSCLQEDRVVAQYRARVSGMELLELERLPLTEDGALPPEYKRLVVREEVSGKSSWFNNEAPPDNLHPTSVEYFISATHERYKQLVGEEFGKTVPGIFTDEPSLHDRHASFAPNRGWIPWTTGMADYYAQKRGRDIFDTLPYLYFNGDKSAKARHDYWRTVAKRYEEAYSGTIGRWCRENNLSFTGHFLQEDKLGLCARVNGSIMPHYRHQAVPGIDMLCERTQEYLTVKQCTSIAHQFGKREVISETYGCTGWDFTFEGQKWIGDWQFVQGITRRCQHLALYSLRGCRKRDYPPSLHVNTSWWRCNYMTEDYFARLGAVLTQGEVVRDVLLVHPMSTAWAMLGTNPYGNPVRNQERDIPAIDRWGYRFNDLIEFLTKQHYDADLGDEEIMSQEARVEQGRLKIGLGDYRSVVLPPMKTMLKETMEHLLVFMEQGGHVIALTPLPSMIEGEPSEAVQKLFSHKNCTVAQSFKEVLQALERVCPRRVSLADDTGCEQQSLLYMLRECEDGKRILFVVNNDRDHAHKVTVRLDAAGAVERWEPLTGECSPVSSEQLKDEMKLCVELPPTGSALYVIDPGAAACTAPVKDTGAQTLEFALPAVTSIERDMPNLLTLDVCSYSLDDAPWSQPLPVWQAQRQVRDGLGMMPIEHNGLLQRYRWIHTPHPGDGHPLRLRFQFEIRDIPAGDVYLVLEGAKEFSIACNGISVGNTPDGWLLDRAFEKVRLSGLIRGSNEIMLTCRYRNDMELEDCYLAGDGFRVDTLRRIIADDDRIRVGDWTLQGYPHYAGSMRYCYSYAYTPREGERVLLWLGERTATCAQVHVGEQSFDVPWSAPEYIDITGALAPGDNKIAVEVYSSLRNMLGPFHYATGKPYNTNDASLHPRGALYTPDYHLHPYGLKEPPRIYRRKA